MAKPGQIMTMRSITIERIGGALNSRRRRPTRRSFKRLEPYALIAPPLIVMALFFFYPILYNIVLSLQSVSLFELGSSAEWVGLGNYVSVLTDSSTALSLKNTVVYLTIATVLLRLVLGLLLAVLLNASVLKRWKLSGLTRAMLIVPWVTPPVVAVAAWKWLLEPEYGAVNQILTGIGIIDDGIPFLFDTSTVWASIITIVVWHELPLVTLALLASLQAIPAELYEAARVDGASSLQAFRHVTFPLLMPTIVILGLLTTVWTYNNFVYVWLATGGGPGDYTEVLATQLYREAFVNYRLGTGAAVGVLMGLVMLVFAAVYFRLLVRARLAQP